MPGERIYWDACVPLSWVEGIPERMPVLDELMRLSRRQEIELVTSILSQVEVAFAAHEKADGKLDPEVEAKIDGLWLPGSPIAPVEFHDLIAQGARTLIRQGIEQGWGKLKPPDAIHLATAQRLDVDRFHTYDERLLKWDGSAGFPITEPATRQGILDEVASGG